MLPLARALVGVASDVLRLVVSFFRSSKAIRAENLVLRKQLAQVYRAWYQAPTRGSRYSGQPRTVHQTVRLARYGSHRSAGDHRSLAPTGLADLLALEVQGGPTTDSARTTRLIRRMAAENPLWGEERIANELLVKLGIRVSPRTVGKYMPKRPPGQPRGDQRWSTFLKNHAKAILACDFFVAVTATFRMLYVFVVIEHGTRRLAHVNVTANPSADWTLQQLRAVVGEEGGHQLPDP